MPGRGTPLFRLVLQSEKDFFVMKPRLEEISKPPELDSMEDATWDAFTAKLKNLIKRYWNEILPGLGLLPAIIGGSVCTFLAFGSFDSADADSTGSQIAVAYALCIAVACGITAGSNILIKRRNQYLDTQVQELCEDLRSTVHGAFTAEYTVGLVGLACGARSGKRTRERVILISPGMVVMEAVVVREPPAGYAGHAGQATNCVEGVQEQPVITAKVIG